MKIHIEETVQDGKLLVTGRVLMSGGVLAAQKAQVTVDLPLVHLIDGLGRLLVGDMRLQVAREAVARALTRPT